MPYRHEYFLEVSKSILQTLKRFACHESEYMEGIIRDEQLKKDAFYQSVYDNLRDIDRRQHENFAFSHQMLNLLEQEKEIQEILDREIKEWKGQWEHYLNTKPLPALPKNKIKGWGGISSKLNLSKWLNPRNFLSQSRAVFLNLC